MARKKVKLQWIANDTARRATLKKRKKGLMKKVSELSTLCGVKACAIVYGPNDPNPEIWPSVHEARDTVLKFKNMPLIEQSKKMMNQETFLRQRLNKAKEQLKKQKRENRVFEMTQLLYATLVGKSLNDIARPDLSDLIWTLEDKLKDVTEKVGRLKRSAQAGQLVDQKIPMQAPMQAPAQIPVQMQMPVQVDNKSVEMMEAMQRQQWLMEMLNAPPPPPHGGGYYGAVEDLGIPYGDNGGGYYGAGFRG
ncbi:hypothetical protein ACHQM5_028725 [Ranunculus cassubicifolius]